MPKISVVIEADSAQEYVELLAALSGAGAYPILEAREKAVRPAKKAEKEVLTASVQGAETAPIDAAVLKQLDQKIEEVSQQIDQNMLDAGATGLPEKAAAEPKATEEQMAEYHAGSGKPEMPEKKARAPRKAKEAKPAETEHVGTVAIMPNGNGEVPTRMDVGDTFARYVQKYGVNFAQTDISKMLQETFGPDVRKKSDIPDDADAFRKAIAVVEKATLENPYNRKVDLNG